MSADKLPAPPATIVLKSLKSRSMQLQIKHGHAERVEGTGRMAFQTPIYVTFSYWLGQVKLREMQRCGAKTREAMLQILRGHPSYLTSFVVWGTDATEEETKLATDLEAQREAKSARLARSRAI